MVKKDLQKQIVVGMSGGVDSSMALVLLKEQGWSPIGVSLKYPVWKDAANCLKENVCCSEESFAIAREVCEKLDVPYHIYDVSRDFRKKVIDYFTSSLRNHKTPNPCVICNRLLKFKKLIEWAKAHKIDFVASGHYARTRIDKKTGKTLLLRGRDSEKDQTYSLSFLTQEQLRKIVLPIGCYTKSEIYKMAAWQDFKIFLKCKQSQDFCFVSGSAMDAFLSKEIGERAGEVRDEKKCVIGRHRGLHFYTIGQRKGLGFSGGPFFVRGSDVARNVLSVTRNEKDLFTKEIYLKNCNFNFYAPQKKLRLRAKIRYRQEMDLATLFPSKNGRAKLVFDKPQRAVTPGQIAVFYKRNVCLGGGEIIS